MKKILIYSVLCLIAALPVSAQKFYKDAINITNASLWQQGESLYINMQMDMRNLKVSNDRTLTLTPVLTGPDNNVVLPEIVINGHIVRYVLLLLLLSAECKRGQVAVQPDVWSP